MAPTIVSQIEDIEQKIASYEDRLDSIDRSLRLRQISSLERDSLTEEEGSIKEQIKEHQNQLKQLRGENRKTMLISMIMLGVFYLVYLLVWPS
ncbi:uncharacterized protein LOC5520756 [Nematostella vectensis]|uniref:uncharacterized protein LOC5520756 n=1 Tax=Nematostella vectensis TaxID=45351 RepID=UPI0013900231|nr:uncharacterized protein LOC5520756 [Nematostella vectensis]